MPTYLITGATGFVGSHVADVCKARGNHVRALARPTADLSHLTQLGVEIVPGDVADPASVAKAVDGVDVVIHAAAKVGDWGPVEDYRTINVQGTQNLLDAVRVRPVRRFVQVSSLGVYEARHHYGTDEAEPLPDHHIDGYTQTKVEAEKLVLEAVRTYAVPAVILRPGFVYGPRDRSVLPRLVGRLKERSILYIARGRYALNTTYVGNIAEACVLAADHPGAVGEVFNITDGELVTKRQFFETVADGLGLKRPRGSIPLWLARRLAAWRESVFRRKNKPHPPRITQASLKFAGLNLDFSIAKARTVLGYEPTIGFADGMARALAWYRETHPDTAR
jgi:2-alkyl-3-oxoalkanoate reductase